MHLACLLGAGRGVWAKCIIKISSNWCPPDEDGCDPSASAPRCRDFRAFLFANTGRIGKYVHPCDKGDGVALEGMEGLGDGHGDADEAKEKKEGGGDANAVEEILDPLHYHKDDADGHGHAAAPEELDVEGQVLAEILFNSYLISAKAVELITPSGPSSARDMNQTNMSLVEIIEKDVHTGHDLVRVECVQWLFKFKGKPFTKAEHEQMFGRECNIRDGHVVYPTDKFGDPLKPYRDQRNLIKDIGIAPIMHGPRPAVPDGVLRLRAMWLTGYSQPMLGHSDCIVCDGSKTDLPLPLKCKWCLFMAHEKCLADFLAGIENTKSFKDSVKKLVPELSGLKYVEDVPDHIIDDTGGSKLCSFCHGVMAIVRQPKSSAS